VQAASAMPPAAQAARWHQGDRNRKMGWILLEAFLALALGIFIVWWTMRGRPKPPPGAQDASPAESPGEKERRG